MKILMVCLGNICRSPLAEGIMKAVIAKAGLDWTVDSAGTAGYHVGEPPHRLSQKVAKQNGIDISKQQCRQFTANDLLLFDKIYVMDSDNYNEVKRISGKHWQAQKVDLLLNASYPNQNRQVPDPWYGGEEGYHEVFDLITKACAAIIQQHTTT
jgi:protein-tyrosine phosphatase